MSLSTMPLLIVFASQFAVHSHHCQWPIGATKGKQIRTMALCQPPRLKALRFRCRCKANVEILGCKLWAPYFCRLVYVKIKQVHQFRHIQDTQESLTQMG